MIPPTVASAVTSVLRVKDVQKAPASMVRVQPIATENPLTHLLIPPTVASADSSVLWVKDVQVAHVQRARGQPIVAENLSILPQTPPTVASVVWPVHQVYPADMAVA